MLTANQLRQVAGRSGARDIGNVEIDVILTYLLQLFAEKGIMDHVGFKGGTMLRKMVFGPRGRLSTDLDFTCCTDIRIDDLMLMMLEARRTSLSFHSGLTVIRIGISPMTAARPILFVPTSTTRGGVKIKLQVSSADPSDAAGGSGSFGSIQFIKSRIDALLRLCR